MDTNYDEWSDFEVNKRLALHQGLRPSAEHECLDSGSCYLLTDIWGDRDDFNPCNTFEDWYPIAEKYGMSIDVKGRASIPKSVSGLDGVISHTCEGSIGRAVSICFLKLTDATND